MRIMLSAPVKGKCTTGLADGGPVIGLDAQAALPVGNFSDFAGVGFGGLLRYEFTVTSSFNVTLRAGFMYHLEKAGSTFYSIPLLAGARVRLGQWAFVAAEAGAFFNHPGHFDTGLGFTFAIGYGFAYGFSRRMELMLVQDAAVMVHKATTGIADNSEQQFTLRAGLRVGLGDK